MFIHLDLGWLSHPFPLSSFRIASAEQIDTIRGLGLQSVRWEPEKSDLAEEVVTESGFGADIGFEEFWNLKCRYSGHRPNAAVVVATIRALKCHGGAPIPVPGRPLDPCYKEEIVGWVEKGVENLIHHINTVKKAGINPVVWINHFHTDTDAEVKAVLKLAEKAGAPVALSQHWLKGGDGALELADAVTDACNQPNNFKFLYELNVPLRTRIEMIAEQVYGADGVLIFPQKP